MISLLLALWAQAGPVYDVPTIRPHLSNDMTALAANHLLLQSMFSLDAAPSTVGFNFKAAPASFELSNGNVTDGSLTKTQIVAMLGGGQPTSGTAWFAGLNYAHVLTGGWPNAFAAAGGDNPATRVSGGGGSAVFFVGMATRGFALEGGVFFNGVGFSQDALGRFGQGCPYAWGCEPAYRPGAPLEPSAAQTYEVTRRSFLVNAEHAGGHSLATLFRQRSVGTEGEIQGTGVAVLRGLSQPYDLFPRALGLLGAGFNSYAADVDYYGDAVAAEEQAADAGRAPPDWLGKGIFEVPLVGDRLADTGALARVTVQALPVPALRLVEVGWADDIELSAHQIFQAGARAKLFRRGLRYAPGGDAYAGLFATSRKHEGRGLSGYLCYAYNSPDPLTFPAVPDAHVLGMQLVLGNPIALPPPVPTMDYPDTAVTP